ESTLQRAKLSYDNAQAALQNIKNKNTTTTKNNIEIQKVTLEKQKKTLSDAKITAPMDGTITMVNAKENGSATGLLFVIEDTDNLIVSTAIGEYDISLIQLGQEVIIKSDSTGDKQFIGAVSQIAPTAIKDASGNTASSSNVQFDTEITMKDKDPNIKIGMNVRLTIKLNEKKGVYSVPYDAITTEANNSQWIQALEAAQKDGKSQSSTKKIQVETGMETDMYVEISSPDLKDGMNVLVGK
ncbi:MAG: transporter, partial [Clostridia bacterium]|nr:transporter [Clostridia bacterium]